MVYTMEACFRHRIKHKKGNGNFLSPNSDYFLTTESLHLAILTFFLRIVSYKLAILTFFL